MDQLVSQIMFFSKKKQYDDLYRYMEVNLEPLKKAIPMIVPAIQALLPASRTYTMGLCYLLYVRLHVPDKSALDMVEQFFNHLDNAQIYGYCGERFGFIVNRYSEVIRGIKQYARGIKVLTTLTNSFRPNPEAITPVHSNVIMLCLLERNYAAAKRLLDDTILEINPGMTGVTPRDFLLYYYYGGMVYIGLKNWERAYEFLQTCITTPCAITLNAIMVEAFKKFVLVSLISRGKFAALPRQCSGIMQRSIKKMCPEYVELANAYGKRENDKIQKVITEHKAIFATDRNLGLLGQVQATYVRQQIQRLTATYVTLSLGDIVKAVGLEDENKAEALLLEMTERGELKAAINKTEKMVSFMDPDVSDVVDAVESEIVNVRRTIERLKGMESSVVVAPEFQMKVIYKDPKVRQEILELEEKLRKSKSMLSKMQDALQM